MRFKGFIFLICAFLLSQILAISSEEKFNTNNETEVVKYYPSGKKKAQGKKKGEKYIGKWIVWWENGNLCRIINYDENGFYHGEQLFYAPDGSLDSKIYYIHGKQVSKEEFEKYKELKGQRKK